MAVNQCSHLTQRKENKSPSETKQHRATDRTPLPEKSTKIVEYQVLKAAKRSNRDHFPSSREIQEFRNGKRALHIVAISLTTELVPTGLNPYNACLEANPHFLLGQILNVLEASALLSPWATQESRSICAVVFDATNAVISVLGGGGVTRQVDKLVGFILQQTGSLLVESSGAFLRVGSRR